MHIALYSPSWPLARYPNGVVTYVHWMREELRRRGHRVSVLVGSCDVPEDGLHVIRPSRSWQLLERVRRRAHLGGWIRLDWATPMADTLRAVHRQNPIDVIEMEESFGWCSRVAARTGIPTVVKLHGPAFLSLVEEELHTPSADAKIADEGVALHRSPVIISPAQRTLSETVARYGLTPAWSRHIVNPLELPPGTPLWSLAGCDRRTVLFVGRFDKRKGGDIVLQAFAQLLATDPDLTLLFAGPDAGVPDAAGRTVHFEEMKAALFPGAAADRVRYLGKLAPHDIYPLRLRALVTLIASRWENQSYTALEAMLQGCPVISTDTGGQGEIIADGRSGLLAVAGDVQSLARQIKVMIDDPERAAAMGAEARRDVLDQHSPRRVVDQTIEAYREAIAMARSGRR